MMSKWIACSERMPSKPVLVVVWRRWPGQEDFGPDFDCWENVDACSGAHDWVLSEDACQGLECIADGPGVVARPETTHWKYIGEPKISA